MPNFTRPGTVAVLALLLSVGSGGIEGSAQQPGEPLLHEYFEPGLDEPVGLPVTLPAMDEGEGSVQAIYGPWGSGEPLPAGLPENAAAIPLLQDAPRQGLDRDTGMDGWLDYHAAFEPSIAPFKRLVALDRVSIEEGRPILGVGEGLPRPVTISELSPSPSPSPELESFWGAVLVLLEPGRPVAIPSVAPDMAVHQVITSPPVELEFYRDGADNYTVLSEEGSGLVRLYYRVSAPRAYFGGPLPATGSLSDIPAGLVGEIPAEMAPTAREAFEMLGLDRESPVSAMVERLSEYLRGFTAEPFPSDEVTGDLYRDILFGGRGVCRHRAFVFVVTAQAWGIPARFVHNEAHAFVEAWLPQLGWRRIDLGGAAEGLRYHNTRARTLHTPVSGDPLATEPPYQASANGRTGDSIGALERETPGTTARLDPDLEPGRPEQDDHRWGPFEDTVQSIRWPGTVRHEGEVEPVTGEPGGMQIGTGEPRTLPSLRMDRLPREAYRGESLHLEGRLEDEQGVGLAGRRVAVLLEPTGGQENGRRVLAGWLDTDEQGLIRGEVTIPASLPLGPWSVRLAFEGDGSHMRAVSE